MSFYPSETGNYSAKTKKRAKYGIVAGAIIVILVMSFMLSRPLVVGSPQTSHKINLVMEARVYREGELIAERINDDDLLVWNFLNLTQALFYWPNDASYDIGFWPMGEMEEVDYTVWNETAGDTIWDTDNTDRRPLVDYGEGTTAPTRDDYFVESSITTEIGLSVFDSDADSFTLTFIWTSDGSYDWSETVLNSWVYSSAWDAAQRIGWARDTFTPIGVESGDSLVVNYRFVFGTGYTSNAITFLQYFFVGASEDGSRSITMTDNSGTSRNLLMYTPTASEDGYVGHTGNPAHGGWIIISDSASGIPARDARVLYGSNVLINSVSAVDGDPNYDVVVSATLIPSSAITVRCAGYYRYTEYVGGEGYFLMWALSHSGVYVAANTPVKVTFTMEM